MFFPNIGNVHITQCGERLPTELIKNSFSLVFTMEKIGALHIGKYRIAPEKYDVFLFPEGYSSLLQFTEEQSASIIVISFTVTDDTFRQEIQALGPRLQIDHFIIRSCLLNILNSYTLSMDNFADRINYNILSLLYYGHLSMQKQAVPMNSQNDSIIFSPSPNEALNRILNYIDEHISEEISIEDLSGAARQSPKQVSDLLKYEYNCTVLQFISRFRLFKAKELLSFTNYSITEISNMTGFRSIHYFSRFFKDKEKIAPMEYKRMRFHVIASSQE